MRSIATHSKELKSLALFGFGISVLCTQRVKQERNCVRKEKLYQIKWVKTSIHVTLHISVQPSIHVTTARHTTWYNIYTTRQQNYGKVMLSVMSVPGAVFMYRTRAPNPASPHMVHCARACSKLVYYEARTVSERKVGIQLKCLLVHISVQHIKCVACNFCTQLSIMVDNLTCCPVWVSGFLNGRFASHCLYFTAQ